MPLVFLDESGFALDSPREYAYGPKGQRVGGIKDWGAKGRINCIGALLAGTLLTAGVFDCTIDASIFNAWLEQDLLPKLTTTSVLIMDNASFHKTQRTKELIEHAGHTLLYLPPYSPDLNPIEHLWAELKAAVKRTGLSIEDILKWSH